MFASGPSGFMIDDHTTIEKSLNPALILRGFKSPYLSYLDCEEHFHFRTFL